MTKSLFNLLLLPLVLGSVIGLSNDFDDNETIAAEEYESPQIVDEDQDERNLIDPEESDFPEMEEDSAEDEIVESKEDENEAPRIAEVVQPKKKWWQFWK